MSHPVPDVPRDEQPEVVAFGPYQFDRRGLLLSRDDEAVAVTPKALLVLRCLLDRPGKVVLKDDLLERVWDGAAVSENSLIEAIRALRQALGDNPRTPAYIETAHRRGYRFIAAVSVDGGGRAAGTDGWGESFLETLGRRIQRFAPWERRILLVSVAVLAVVATATSFGTWRYWSLSRTSPTSQPALRFPIALPTSLPLSSGVAVSPDGRQMAYTAAVGDSTQIVLKEWDRFGFTVVAGTEGARGSPSFSPDGRELAFKVRGDAEPLWTIKKVSVDGSSPVALAYFGIGNLSLRWESDDNIYINRRGDGAIYRVSSDGGDPDTLRTPDRSSGEESSGPQLLPDGRTLLFTSVPLIGSRAEARAVLLSLDTGDEKTLLEGVSGARYMRSGHLVYTRAGSVWAMPFDVAEHELRGTESRVVDRANGLVFYDHDTLVYLGSPPDPGPGGAQSRRGARPVWVDRSGDRRPLSLPTPDGCLYPSLSPDGIELALACRGEGSPTQIWLGNLERGTFTRWQSEGESFTPIWTPGGAAITYSSRLEDIWSIRTKRADGSAPEEILLTSEYPLFPSSWSPDGKVLAFLWILPDTGEDIWLLPAAGERTPTPWLNSPHHESGARFSPNGEWIAYHSDVSGMWHVYAEEYPGPGAKLTLSSADGGWPVWSRDGRKLVYLSNPERLAMVIDFQQGPGLIPGKPRPLLEQRIVAARSRQGPAFDLAPDGESLLFIGSERASPQPRTRLHVVLNWSADLERLAPTGR